MDQIIQVNTERHNGLIELISEILYLATDDSLNLELLFYQRKTNEFWPYQKYEQATWIPMKPFGCVLIPVVKRVLAIKSFYKNQIILTASDHLNKIKCFILFQYKAEFMNWKWWIIANFLALLTLYESEWPLALDGIVNFYSLEQFILTHKLWYGRVHMSYLK